jgi:cold shock CspA family protein
MEVTMINYSPDAKLFKDTWNLPYNPFPFLGADNYDDEQILSLFEIDKEANIQAFALQNSLIEGSYGTGKTMFLKAIYCFYNSKMIVDIAESGKCAVIPVYIKFSDLPYDSDNIYREIILNIYKKLLDTRFIITGFLQSPNWFDKFKFWLQRLNKSGIFNEDRRYNELSADSVTKRVNNVFKGDGEIGTNWLKGLSLAYEKKYETEIVKKPNPSIVDIDNLLKEHFKDVCQKVLLLIDEVDRLPASAFSKTKSRTYSVYETIFNQLRTNANLFYKVAVYPNTDSSKQLEGSRIGTRIKLGFNSKDLNDFASARDFFYRLLKSYLSNCVQKEIDPDSIFHIKFKDKPYEYAHRYKTDRCDRACGDALEQLVFGSNGIVRRFIKLASDSMYKYMSKPDKRGLVGKYDVFDAMRDFGKELIERLQEHEQALIDRAAYYCMQNNKFRFRASGHEKLLEKLHDRSKQDNILYPILDQDRKGVTYIFEFDYCYCLYRNIPTHRFYRGNYVNKERTLVNGHWLISPADMPSSVITLEGKIEGTIRKYNEQKGWGFITYLPDNDLYFYKTSVISIAPGKSIQEGQKAIYRVGRNYRGECAADIEIT